MGTLVPCVAGLFLFAQISIYPSRLTITQQSGNINLYGSVDVL